jgi:hypothetical protein
MVVGAVAILPINNIEGRSQRIGSGASQPWSRVRLVVVVDTILVAWGGCCCVGTVHDGEDHFGQAHTYRRNSPHWN